MRRIWAVGCGALVLAAAFVGLAIGGEKTPQEAQAEDIGFFQTHYLEKDRAMGPDERVKAQALLDALKAKAGQLSRQQLFLGLAEVVAAANNAHSLISFGSAEALPSTKLPFVLVSFDNDELVVDRALPEQGDLAGATVTAIEGRRANEVLAAFRKYYGGTEARRTIFATGLLGAGGMLQAAGLAASAAKVHMTFRKRDGSIVEREIAYVPVASAANAAWWPSRWWSPQPIPNDPTPWQVAIDATNLPLYLQDADKFERLVPLPDLDAVYIEFKTNEGDRGAGRFSDEAEAQLRALKPRNVIVDLRFDKGGDLRLNASLMRSLTQLIAPDGRVFLIVGRYTMSAGIVAAAIAKRAGGDRVTIVGESVGDTLRFWSEGEVVCAPNSNYCAKWTDGLFDLHKGCKGEPDCYRENFSFDMVVGSLEPDLPAPMTAAAWFAKRDPAMDAIRAKLGK